MTMTNSFKKKKKKEWQLLYEKQKRKEKITQELEKINFQMCKHIQENYKIKYCLPQKKKKIAKQI